MSGGRYDVAGVVDHPRIHRPTGPGARTPLDHLVVVREYRQGGRRYTIACNQVQVGQRDLRPWPDTAVTCPTCHGFEEKYVERDLNALIKVARAQGAEVTSRNGKLVWKVPGGGPPIFSSQHAGRRGHALGNLMSELTRAGLNLRDFTPGKIRPPAAEPEAVEPPAAPAAAVEVAAAAEPDALALLEEAHPATMGVDWRAAAEEVTRTLDQQGRPPWSTWEDGGRTYELAGVWTSAGGERSHMVAGIAGADPPELRLVHGPARSLTASDLAPWPGTEITCAVCNDYIAVLRQRVGEEVERRPVRGTSEQMHAALATAVRQRHDRARKYILRSVAKGPAESAPLLERLRLRGVGDTLAHRLRNELGVVSYQQGRRGWWCLPKDRPSSAEPESDPSEVRHEEEPMRDRPTSTAPAPLPPRPAVDGAAITDFAGAVVALMEEELQRRTASLMEQNQQLRTENADLRQELADTKRRAETVRERAIADAMAAARRVIEEAELR